MSSFGPKGSEINRNQFNKLVEENLRLGKQLLFANKCLKTLITFKSFVDFISNKFKTNLNSNEWQKFEKLRKDVEKVLKSKDKPIERKTTKILPQNFVSSSDENGIDIDEDNYENRLVQAWSTNYNSLNKLSEWTEEMTDPTTTQIFKTKITSNDKNEENKYEQNGLVHILIPRLECDYPGCGKKFKYQSHLNAHKRTVHSIKFESEVKNRSKSRVKSKDKPIERTTSEILPKNVVFSEDENGIDLDYDSGGSHLWSTNKKSAQNGIKTNENSIHSSEDNIKTKETNSTSMESIDSDNEMTPKALYKSNITYNRRNQSNICSQNTDKSVNELNESTEEMTDPTTTQTIKTEIISNERLYKTQEINNFLYFSQNLKNFGNVYNINETQLPTNGPKCIEKRRKYVDNQLEGPVIVNIKPSNSSTDPKINSVFKCPVIGCDKWMAIDFIPKHSLEIHNQFVVICDQNKCHKVFISSAKYDEHKSRHHPKDKPFKSLKNKSINAKLNENDSKKCDICGKVFDSKLKVSRHKKFVHIHSRNLECDFPGCGKKFKVKKLLNCHKKYVHPSIDLKVECNQCNKVLKNKRNLISHKRTYHSGKLLACNWPGCEYRCKYKQYLEKHQTSHRPEKNYVCDWPECGKAYKISDYLSKHMKSHTRTDALDKRYSCDWPGCQFRTAYAQNITPHKKNIHQKE